VHVSVGVKCAAAVRDGLIRVRLGAFSALEITRPVMTLVEVLAFNSGICESRVALTISGRSFSETADSNSAYVLEGGGGLFLSPFYLAVCAKKTCIPSRGQQKPGQLRYMGPSLLPLPTVRLSVPPAEGRPCSRW